MSKKIRGLVYVHGKEFNTATKTTFLMHEYVVTNILEAADVVVLTGGADINPRIYGEKNVAAFDIDERRDADDLRVIEAAWKLGKFLVGICRGAQILNCRPNGGTLWQNVDLHEVSNHTVRDMITMQEWCINSSHHQMMRPAKDAVMVAACKLSLLRRAEGRTEKGVSLDPEVLWYPSTRSLCFQAHPEWNHAPTTSYFFHLMERYYENKGTIDIDGTEDGYYYPYPSGTGASSTISTAYANAIAYSQPRPEYNIGKQPEFTPLSEAGVCDEITTSCANLPGGTA